MGETRQNPPRWRVLHCTRSLASGGRLQAILNLVRSNEMRAVAELHLATLAEHDPVPDEASKLAASVTVIGRKSLFDMKSIKRLRKLISDRKINLVHVHDAASQIALSIALRGLSCPLVMTFHRSSDIDSKPWRLRMLCFPANLRTKAIITTSKERAEHYRHYHFGVGDRIRIIHHGIDLDRFRPDHEQKQLLCRRLGIPDNAIIIGTIGHFGEEKGVDLAIRAALRTIAARPNQEIHHLILGSGNDEQTAELQSIAKGSGFVNRVHWLGFQSRPETFIAGFDLLLHGARLEAFGLVLAEALACGCPVVSTRCGGALEILADGECGSLVDIDDETAMSTAVTELIANDSVAAEYRRAARVRAEQHFSSSASIAKHLSLYESITETES